MTRLSALADAYRTRWWAATDTQALDTAVSTLCEAEAVARSIGVDPARPAGNLAVVLADRFADAGDDADLDAALEAASRARDGSPAGHPDRGTHMLLHATLLSDRYDRHGLLADLHDALAVAYATLDEDLDDDRELARLQNLLGVLELDRFQIEDDAAHLTVAVDWARAATATADPADPALAGYLTNLGAAHRLAFESTLSGVDWSGPLDVEVDVIALRAALDAHRRAVGLSPEGSADHPMHLTNLGAVLLDAAVVLPEEVGIDETVAVLEAAVAQTHAASPHLGGRWNNLAAALRTMADRNQADDSRAATDAERAHTAFREAVASSTPEAGLSAAVAWSSWSVLRTAWPEIAEASRSALDTADRLRRTQLTRGDRMSWLRRVEGISATGAHADARLGDPAAAALLAERGRALLLSDALDRDRTRLESLAADRPDLAARLSAAAAAVRQLESFRAA